MELQEFKHKITVSVRFNDVDMLGVCNNAVYINFFEEGRLQYLKHLKLFPEKDLFKDDELYFIVRNEVNYRAHSHYDDKLNVYTRVSYIKNSSFGFEHIIENAKTKEIVADGKGVIAHVNPKTRKSSPLPERFYRLITGFESNVKVLKTK
ncbi:MAG TPA: thioesterase family protein [Ignavibacteriaceae bacterium]|jgi:acyl-CoA thioester hydrolase|nr:thioesterase family protein [Ignavibacteriaceae bacterium]